MGQSLVNEFVPRMLLARELALAGSHCNPFPKQSLRYKRYAVRGKQGKRRRAMPALGPLYSRASAYFHACLTFRALPA